MTKHSSSPPPNLPLNLPPSPEFWPPSPGFWGGAWASLLVTLPLTALGYLAAQFSALPFVPFAFFDLLVRVLPGPVVTAGIDTLVNAMTALNLPLADLAKVVEQTLALVIFTLLAVLAGAVFFARQRNRRVPWGAGLAFGLIVGAPLAGSVWRITAVGGGAPSPLPAGAWTLLFTLFWGLLLTAVQRRLTRPGSTKTTIVTLEAAQAEARERREFMVYLGGSAALVTVIVGGGVAAALGMRRSPEVLDEGTRWSALNPLPNANAAVQPVPGTRAEYTNLEQHYRIDINLTPPVVQEEAWRLRVEGLVDAPLELSLAELRAYEPVHQFITMACISNPVGGSLTSTTRWTGVPLGRLLAAWGVQGSATHLRISSADGFFEYVALADIRNDERIMLTYAWDGVPLRIRNGFPLRIYIPDLYGMKQPKWIEAIEAVDAWELGYWVRRGWDETARMHATSVIDSVATDALLTEDARELVPIGGVAHAGARGVSKVEVQVDSGEWQQAELRQPLSELSWVVWRYEWPYSAGEHTFTVRCTDGNGETQLTEVRSPHPSGATGLDRVQVRL